jgi:HEAT repeat protein
MKFPPIDLFSFGLGFILATVFWLILLRVSKLIPNWKKAIAENRAHQQYQKDLDREHGFRLLALRKAQESHLAFRLFPLEQILIEPSVITPQKFLPQSVEDFDSEALYHLLPELPEFPALYSQSSPVVFNSLEALISAGQQFIALSAEPGFGKTTALAALASQLSRESNSNRYLPLFFDYNELQLEEKDIQEAVLDHLAGNIKNLHRENAEAILQHANEEKRLVFLIDNLDILHLSEFNKALLKIGQLKERYPNSFFVLAVDPYIHGELQKLGFEIFSLAVWSEEEKTRLLLNWKKAWIKLVNDPKQINAIERVACWLRQESMFDSPLEITLQIWSAFAELKGSNSQPGIYQNYLHLFTNNLLEKEEMASLLEGYSLDPIPTLLRENFTGYLQHILESRLSEDSGIPVNAAENTQQVNSLINNLVSKHFLYPLNENTFGFYHPSIIAHFYAAANEHQRLPDFEEVLLSPTKRQIFKDRITSEEDAHLIDHYLQNSDPYFHRDLLFALPWTNSSGTRPNLKQKLFKYSALLLQDTRIPVSLRFRFLLPLVESRDPSILSLFLYLSTLKEENIRQVSALGLGMFHDEKAVAQLRKLAEGDGSASVQQLACISLNRIWSQSAQAALVDLIFAAEENLRELICELVSLHHPEGEQILQELAETDNYLARKAAVYGLVHIHQPWVNPLLEKMSIEDTQWVVRDTAKFALEHPRSSATFIAQKPIPPLENPWIVQKADEYSIVLPKKGLPVDLLLTLLEKEDREGKLAALDYLSQLPTPEVIEKMRVLTSKANEPIRDEIFNALFEFGKNGLAIR